MQKIFTVIIITLNTIGVFFFTGMDFPIFGIALSILSILCSIFFSEYVWMHVFATTVIRSHNIGKYFSKGNANRIVISVAFLSLAVKIGVLIKTGIYLHCCWLQLQFYWHRVSFLKDVVVECQLQERITFQKFYLKFIRL